MARVLLLLGGNRGGLERTFAMAREAIAARMGPVLAVSRAHRTAPWGFADDHDFLNQAVLVGTDLSAEAIMQQCLAIERDLGRVRTEQVGEQRTYGPRIIDIDVLLMEDTIIDAPGIVVPHPRMHERAFALSPAADLVPGWVHPQLGRSVLSLLHHVKQGP